MAITISPRMVAVLAAAWHFTERLNAPLLVIHGGAPDAQKEAEFRDAMFQLEMPRETRIVWNEGEPAGAIVTAAEKEGVDLLIAGALEGKDVASRSFLGAVARPLAKLARCSLLLLTHPQIGPNPFRRIVVITDFSDCAKTALKNALWLAEADSAELVQVISIHTPFMQTRAELGAEYEKPTRKREEEEQLLRDFVATAPASGVPVESKIVDTTTGFAACDFTQLATHLQVTPQTLSNWLYRRKRPSLDKYLALTEFSTQNAVMEMPPRVRKLLNELEAYAKRNRMKQQDLAKELGVVPQQLSDWLRGHRTPNAERILKIQEFLRIKNS